MKTLTAEEYAKDIKVALDLAKSFKTGNEEQIICDALKHYHEAKFNESKSLVSKKQFNIDQEQLEKSE